MLRSVTLVGAKALPSIGIVNRCAIESVTAVPLKALKAIYFHWFCRLLLVCILASWVDRHNCVHSLLLRPVALDPKAEELCLLFIGVAIRRSLRFVPDDGEPTARIICPRWRRRPGNLNLQNHHHHHLSFFFIHIMPTWIEFFALCANPRRMRLLCNCSGGRHRNGRGMGSRTP